MPGVNRKGVRIMGSVDGVQLGLLAIGPRGHRDPGFLAAKRARLFEAQVAPLQDLAEEIRQTTGGEVPAFDPDSGGIFARALFLFEAPGARSTAAGGPRAAAKGSGIISEDNDDPSAQNMWLINRSAQLQREMYLPWNVVAWYIGSTTQIREATLDDLTLARPWLGRLIALLPELRVVATFGAVPLRGWMDHLRNADGHLIPTLAGPHPSARVLNTRPEARAQIEAVTRRVAAIVA